MDRGIKMEKTKDLKNKKLVRRLIQLSQPKKDISKTFKVEDEKKYHLDTVVLKGETLPYACPKTTNYTNSP